MIKAKRFSQNPLIVPQPDNPWEQKGSFNPSVVKRNQKFIALYRAIDSQGLSTIAKAVSQDGLKFSHQTQFLTPQKDWEKYGLEDPRITYLNKHYYITYTALSSWPPNPKTIKLAMAVSPDLKSITQRFLITPFNAKAGALFPRKINGYYYFILTANTDQPPAKIAIAKTRNFSDFQSLKFWQQWYSNLNSHSLKISRISSDHVELGSTPIYTDFGWLIFYSHIQNYSTSNHKIFGIEALLLDLKKPKKIIGRTREPLLIPQEKYELQGQVKNVIFPGSAVENNGSFYLYYGAADTVSAGAQINQNLLLKSLKNNPKTKILKLKKCAHNPILTPIKDHPFESKAVFNPTAIYLNKKVYLFYRALSEDMVSTIGLAILKNGYQIQKRFEKPIYVPRMSFEQQQKPGNYSGCEDPRITKLKDRFYLSYTAYDGVNPPKVALTSIKEKDFLSHNWIWTEPKIISMPGTSNKNAALFPEKNKGQYLFLHRTGGRDIAVDWVKNLNDLSGNTWLEKEAAISPIPNSWQGKKIGIASPPIKTDNGWLMLYHGVSDIDHHYRVGAMLLDLQNPNKILARTQYPILEPTKDYEKKGLVDNVVFPCGMVKINQTLFIYYGGADQVVAVATIKLNKLLEYLLI